MEFYFWGRLVSPDEIAENRRLKENIKIIEFFGEKPRKIIGVGFGTKLEILKSIQAAWIKNHNWCPEKFHVKHGGEPVYRGFCGDYAWNGGNTTFLDVVGKESCKVFDRCANAFLIERGEPDGVTHYYRGYQIPSLDQMIKFLENQI